MKDYRDFKGPGLKLSKEDCQCYELDEYNYAMASLVGFIMEAFDSKDNFLAKRGEE